MPKSKRNKLVTLSKTKSKGMELKSELVENVKNCVDEYAYIYVFSVENMRNNKIKDVRNEWKTSRFFFGKNKVMAFALGKTKENEYKENLHRITEHLKGNVGLLFTNKSKDEVVKWFDDFKEIDYARSGNTATENITLPEGALDAEQYIFSMEPQMRQLGLPTKLKKGVIHLTEDYVVCKAGETLSPEQCRILKMFKKTMAEFHIRLMSMWSSDGTFEELSKEDDLMNILENNE
eukprot:gene11913-13147_t